MALCLDSVQLELLNWCIQCCWDSNGLIDPKNVFHCSV